MAKHSNNRNLYVAATIACLTAALFGYSVGFIGGVIVLPSFLRNFHLDGLPKHELAAAQSQAVVVWLIGALFGVPLGMPICSRLGRRRCLQFSSVLYVLGAALQLVDIHGNPAVFEVGRLLNGLGVGAGTLVSPMYIAEISPPSERGMLMSGYQTSLQMSALIGFWGAFVSNAIFASASSLQWRAPVAIQLLPGAFLMLGTLIIPESPRFQAERGDYKGIEASLTWLRRLSSDDDELLLELEQMKEAASMSAELKSKSKNFASEALKPDVRRRLLVGIGLMIAQNMVGLNALNYYCPVIFMSAGFTSVSASLFLTGIFGLVKLISALAFMFSFVRIKGNRFWLKTGCAVCGLSMLVLAYFVKTLDPSNPHLTLGGIVSVAMVYIFAFSFGVSLGPISWNVCSEIFPLHINATCCAITVCTQWLFQIVIAGITPRLLASVGWMTYVIYAVFCAISYTFTEFFVPETRGVGLGRPMDELFGKTAKDHMSEDAEQTEEVMETAPLLRNEQRIRRSSLVSYA